MSWNSKKNYEVGTLYKLYYKHYGRFGKERPVSVLKGDIACSFYVCVSTGFLESQQRNFKLHAHVLAKETLLIVN